MEPALIWQCFYFMLPAYFANMAPVIVKKINFLKYPLDFGKRINGKRVFGENKTFRGLFFGIVFGIIVAYFQNLIGVSSIVDYSNWHLLGLLLGSGAIIGDSVESFFKRQLGIKPGTRFFPFDQIDFVIGAIVFSSLVVDFSVLKIIIILLISILGHIIVNHSAYYLRIRDEKW
jgi:CDP-2,3-bis-(O-geranylgeranyl)-sn-glycerol synthase